MPIFPPTYPIRINKSVYEAVQFYLPRWFHFIFLVHGFLVYILVCMRWQLSGENWKMKTWITPTEILKLRCRNTHKYYPFSLKNLDKNAKERGNSMSMQERRTGWIHLPYVIQTCKNLDGSIQEKHPRASWMKQELEKHYFLGRALPGITFIFSSFSFQHM